jgi:AraC family ethanolamine operon transcriptional activator
MARSEKHDQESWGNAARTILTSGRRPAPRAGTGDNPEYLARQRAHQRVNAAREFINASLRTGRVPSIVDICAQTGASARTLQYAFREVMQLPPAAYLRTLRLNEARGALRTATVDTTVTRIATDWGFFHLGEFARDYQRLFGEYPSETRSRALARAAG